MFKRQRTGAVICASCGKLVGAQDKECFNCGARNPALWGFAPLLRKLGYDMGFESIVMWGCAALYLTTLLVDPAGIRNSGISLLTPSSRSLFMFGASGAYPVFIFGRWWTILSAGWLHGNLLHIVFNLMWVRQLAPAAAELYGTARMAIIYTVSCAAGFLLSSTTGYLFGGTALNFLAGAQFTLGASAPIFGLLGALVLYGRRRGSSGISSQAMGYALVLFVFGFLMQGIDNFAHLGGFIGGYAAARFLDPMRPERVGHVVLALALTACTALSIILSLVQGRTL
jgi:rhomboid protease GluP